MAQLIPVKTPDGGGYDIIIEPGLLGRLAERAESYGLTGRCAIVTNETLVSLYGIRFVQQLPRAALVTLPDGEQHKTLFSIAALYDDFIDAGLDRHSTVIALGGGVIGDTAGFAAATYLRGVRFVQVPTSLLAMVDSSVGGKVGVDLPQGKNLVGAFKQPDLVLIDPQVLDTLPPQEWSAGMAELIKHGLLADPALLEMAADAPRDQMSAMIGRAVQVKVDVVQADPYEQNIRAHLNLGHTFAHAIERVSQYQIPHGQAVGIGLAAALRLSQHLGMCEASLIEQTEALLTQVGLPIRLDGLDPAAIYAAMSTDKKRVEGKLRFVLLRGVGKPEVVEGVEESAVMQVLKDIL
jgi:3-dehydroquinate synthase